MRLLLVLGLVAVALGACASGSAGTGANGTALTVNYWENGIGVGERETWTVRCNPARGTLARPGIACRRLIAGGAGLFAGVPADLACTQIYGGPQVARVVGRVKGVRVSASVNRTDGCQISRWDRLSPWLLPAAGVR